MRRMSSSRMSIGPSSVVPWIGQFHVSIGSVSFRPSMSVTIPVALELSQAQWCTLYTRGNLVDASSGLELDLVSDESVYDYEQQHLAKEAWPPTGWFADWTKGLDLFDLPHEASPVELRWLVYRRR